MANSTPPARSGQHYTPLVSGISPDATAGGQLRLLAAIRSTWSTQQVVDLSARRLR